MAPETWPTVRLGEVASDIAYGLTASAEERAVGPRFVRITDLQDGRIDWPNVPYCRAEEDDRFLLRPGDILFARTGGTTGKSHLVTEVPEKAAFASYLIRVRPNERALATYLAYFFRSHDYWAQIRSAETGTAQPGVNATKLAALELPLPPIDVQRRIVAKLDALLAQSRAAREQLAAVPDLVATYRQSVLAAAFRGDLTADWRKKTPDVEPIEAVLKHVVGTLPAPRMANKASTRRIAGRAALSVGPVDVPAPSGWRQTRLIDVARLESGHTPSRSHPEYWGEGIPWIGIRDAGANHGQVITSTAQTVSKLGLENSAARLLPIGTVCLSRTASVGYATVMGLSMATSQDFVNWVCTEALVPKFLMYMFMAEGEHLRRFGEGSTHTTIYFPEVLSFHALLPPVAEQHEIVRRLDVAMARVKGLGAVAHEALEAAAVLDSSVLVRAFSGELAV